MTGANDGSRVHVSATWPFIPLWYSMRQPDAKLLTMV